MINRHFTKHEDILTEDIARNMKRMTKICEAVKHRPANTLGRAFEKSLATLSLLIMGSREQAEILRILKLATSLGVINFQFGTKVGESFDCTLEGETFTLIGQEMRSYMGTKTWLNAIFCSLISRDRHALNYLCQIPESLHEQAAIKPDPVDLAFVRCIKGLFNPSADMEKLLDAAIKASFPDLIPSHRSDDVDYILFPQLLLYIEFFSNAPSEFNKKLNEAVLNHQKFWAEGDRKYSPDGWIALPLIAAAALAFDERSYPFTVETEYIPSWLVKGEF